MLYWMAKKNNLIFFKFLMAFRRADNYQQTRNTVF